MINKNSNKLRLIIQDKNLSYIGYYLFSLQPISFMSSILDKSCKAAFPETQELDLRLETVNNDNCIYLMLSTIIVFIKDERIKTCYYIINYVNIGILSPNRTILLS